MKHASHLVGMARCAVPVAERKRQAAERTTGGARLSTCPYLNEATYRFLGKRRHAYHGLILDNHPEKCEVTGVLNGKFEQLRRILQGYGSCLVAYSGGVDSVLLAKVAHDVLGERTLAVIADSPSLPRRELQEALELAETFHFPVRIVKTAEFENPAYLANPANRCYFCKHELFDHLAPLARAEHFAVIAYGENASDAGDFRPGAKAAAEFQVRAPLKEAGLTKAEIRKLSAQLGLPTADKPQMACLSSRIPYGEAVTPEKLAMIEAAENVLRDLGFYEVRVRHHESGGSSGKLARIEIALNEIPQLLAGDILARVSGAIQKLGYQHVTLDLQGYRRGSVNEVLKAH